MKKLAVASCGIAFGFIVIYAIAKIGNKEHLVNIVQGTSNLIALLISIILMLISTLLPIFLGHKLHQGLQNFFDDSNNFLLKICTIGLGTIVTLSSFLVITEAIPKIHGIWASMTSS